MSNRFVLLLIFLLIGFSAPAQILELSDKDWMLETEKMSYRIGIRGERLNTFYYGPKVEGEERKTVRWNEFPEVPVRGVGAWNSPVVEAVFKDNVRDLDLKYHSSELLKDGEYDVLRILLKDSYYPYLFMLAIGCFQIII